MHRPQPTNDNKTGGGCERADDVLVHVCESARRRLSLPQFFVGRRSGQFKHEIRHAPSGRWCISRYPPCSPFFRCTSVHFEVSISMYFDVLDMKSAMLPLFGLQQNLQIASSPFTGHDFDPKLASIYLAEFRICRKSRSLKVSGSVHKGYTSQMSVLMVFVLLTFRLPSNLFASSGSGNRATKRERRRGSD